MKKRVTETKITRHRVKVPHRNPDGSIGYRWVSVRGIEEVVEYEVPCVAMLEEEEK